MVSKYENVYEIFKKSNFEDHKVDFLHGYIDDANFILQDIDYSICFIKRTPDNDPRVKIQEDQCQLSWMQKNKIKIMKNSFSFFIIKVC